MFWKKKRSQVEQAVDEVAQTATELAEKSLVIGWGGVALLVGAAAVGAAATYVVAKRRQDKKAAQKSGFSKT
ncbi:MAG: hypothetical protein BGN85_04780 [Alphaproteobacteria bacterium 64-11]|nr:hypothetical protein [Alphaproteobacteria bacterium]OJU12848.1 MAG: hypothetical protein BGN85_04780 [Alphaproteobacteria bacterium 64-11]